MHCLTCKYDLSNLTEHRCPECGRAFDPNDATTFYTGVRPFRYPYWLIAVIGFVSMYFFSMWLMYGGLLPGLGLAALVVTLYMICHRWMFERNRN